MKAGIFDPYLDTLGGGERYVLTLAEHFLAKRWQVELFWDGKNLKKELEERFNLKLKGITFLNNIFKKRGNLWQRWQMTKNYDLIFYFSDGSVPFLFAKKNLLHFQVPFTKVNGKSILNRLKFKKIHGIICNSEFTKKIIGKEYGIKGKVVYPPVDVENFQPGKKENEILAVGRFSRILHAKKQEVLLEVFKKMCDQGLKNWQLILAGGMIEEERKFLEQLKSAAANYPVLIQTNVSFDQLQNLYGRARIFWHAAGFGENELDHPERMEHFGITTVEAMAAGCVPVVVNKGGLPEIVNNGVSGFLWETEEELQKKTLQLIKSPRLTNKISLQAIKDSRKFSKKIFGQKIDDIIEN